MPAFGYVAIDKTGKVLFTRSQYNGKAQLPWMKEAPANNCDVTIERKDSSKEELYRFFTWSGGDVLLDLEGVPPVIEFVR